MKSRPNPTTSDGQARLMLVPARTDFLEDDRKLEKSIVELTKKLVSIPSQGGVDSQKTIVDELSDWFQSAGLHFDIVRSERRKYENSFLGLSASVGTGRAPFYLVTACLDTAPFGDKKQWTFEPTSAGEDHKGWLHGRGAADSKVAISIFSHLMADLRRVDLNGTLVFLADSDEHTGNFGAIKKLVQRSASKKFSGAFIGYPGIDSIKCGARGFHRSRVRFFGTAQHTGSRKACKDDALQKAVRFCTLLNDVKKEIEQPSSDFPLMPKITVTSIHGGTNSFSITSDSCYVGVDIRLTPSFQKPAARKLMNAVALQVTQEFGGQKPKITNEQSWPAYQIGRNSPLISSLATAAEAELGYLPDVEVCGPSNVGNYLASVGVDAVCGFGVAYKGIHSVNESIDLSTIGPVYNVYRSALLSLLS